MTAHDRYHALLRMVRHNVGGEQPVMTSAHHLWTICTHADISKTDALPAMQAARENGDVLRWRDGDGQWRYGITPDGDAQVPFDTPAYGPGDRESFRAIIDIEASRDEPNRDVIGWCNRWLQRIDAE